MAFPRSIRAVVFDMDGLLVDTESIMRDAMLGAAGAVGADLPAAVFLSMVGTTHEASDAIMREHFGPDFDMEAYLGETRGRYAAMIEAGAVLKAGVVELLDHLDDLGLPRAICTSSSHATVEAHLGPSGLLPRFAAVIARGDYVHGKPTAEPYLAAAARLGVPAEDCLALEDSHNGVRAAHAAGMMTVMVPDLLQPTDEMHDKCVAIVESLHHVLAMLVAECP